MSNSRDKQIDAIFKAALDLPENARQQYVDNECNGDADLKREVLALLRASESTDDTLDTQVSEMRNRLLRSVFDEDTDTGEDLCNKTIHHWRLESKIARGGLATVYLARRDDGEFEQKAAFKVLRRGLDTDDLIARFKAERQILSTLDHPAIARILDGGALEDGRPYLVLEYVEGVPITEYCTANGVSVRDRVILMIEILRALHQAHSHLVVHRDIKPSNILVSVDANVCLLDFGIAKLLDPATMPGASTMTRTGISLLTPSYGSPEQHAGEPVTTASDIYQCGLVLYEMLVGRRAFEAQPTATTTLVPSQQLKGRQEYRHVHGDLDAIVRKATRGDPGQRYASADEMVRDLQRYLDGLPVIAQPDSIRYRVAKLAKRRPWLIPVMALTVLGIATYIATITVYSQRLSREEQLAQASQQFLVDLFRSPDPFAPADSNRGSNITVVEALGIGRHRIDDELTDQPELRASLLDAISEVYDSLDQNEEALAMREEALKLERSLNGSRSPKVIASLRALGGMYRSQGNPDKADQYTRQQLQFSREIFSANSPQLALAEIAAGIHANASGRIEESRSLLRSGIEKLRPERIRYARELIGALIVSAENNGMGVAEDVFETIAEAQQIAQEAYGPRSVQAASVQVRLASSMTMYGDYEGSERNFREALPVLEQRLGKDHGSTLRALNNLGYLYTRKGEAEKAEPIYRELLDRQIRLYGIGSRRVADSYQNLGGTLAKLGRYDEALPMHHKAYDIFRKTLTDDNYIIGFPLLSIAYAELQRNNADQAEQAASEALQRFENSVPGTFLEGVARCLIGLSLEAQGRVDEGSAMVLGSHELMKTGSIPDPYPSLCRMPGR